jgi:pimeloyl-ACP methyl ester carboxylesterase
MDPIVIQANGREVLGSVFVPQADPAAPNRTYPGILFVHGLQSDQSGYQVRAKVAVRELNVVCLTFDLSGHGPRAGPADLESLTPRDHLSDVMAAYDTLAAVPGVDKRRIGACAASYGAYLATLLTGRRSIDRLLLRAPGMYTDNQYRVPLTVSRRSRAGSSTSMLIETLKAFTGELLVVESGADEVIPRAVIDAYLDAFPAGRYVVIPDATHALVKQEWREFFLAQILNFFRWP